MNKHTPRGDVVAEGKDDSGFTLVEILIAIVLIGILSAVAVVGINSLTSSGSDSACGASADSAKAASAVYFAANGNSYPKDFFTLTGTDPTSGAVTGVDPALELPSGAKIDTTGLIASSGDSWTLTMKAGTGTARPAFVCS